MTTAIATVTDSTTMLRRNLRHMIRYPGLTGFVIGVPVVLLLLFVYVFGGTLGAGLPTAGSGGPTAQYLAYVTPGILLIGVAGIVARFRSMAVSRAAVLNGHVLGNTVQGLIWLAVVLGVAVLMGLRASAGPLGWLALVGFLAVVCFAVSWVAVAMGMSATTVETASNTPMIFTPLPFLGSGFVPTGSMPTWLRVFADWQPFTAYIETVRALLAGQSAGGYLWLSLGWCVVLSVGGFLWARTLYIRRSIR